MQCVVERCRPVGGGEPSWGGNAYLLRTALEGCRHQHLRVAIGQRGSLSLRHTQPSGSPPRAFSFSAFVFCTTLTPLPRPFGDCSCPTSHQAYAVDMHCTFHTHTHRGESEGISGSIAADPMQIDKSNAANRSNVTKIEYKGGERPQDANAILTGDTHFRPSRGETTRRHRRRGPRRRRAG